MKHYLPGWAQSLVLVVIFFAGSLVTSVLYLLGVKSNSLIYAVTMVFPLLFAYIASQRNRKMGLGYVPLNDPQSGKFKSMVPVFAIAILATPFLGALLEPITSQFKMSDTLRAAFEKMFDTSHPVDLFISVSILAPLCEELLCRGIICRGMLSRNKPWVAILFSAFIFALLHGNLQQGFAALGLGAFMGWIYYKTHSLWCTIAIHFTNNTLSQVMMYSFPDLNMDATYADVIPQPWYGIFLVVSAVIVAAAIYLIQTNYNNEQSTLSFAVRPSAGGETLGRECPSEEV
ncbi:MAG: CPBP family intramembrane metalloprotease [Bacteroidales bacterium]|nr:CPBP family intramembrane metalloprotease [Bacteroidales bacterium]